VRCELAAVMYHVGDQQALGVLDSWVVAGQAVSLSAIESSQWVVVFWLLPLLPLLPLLLLLLQICWWQGVLTASPAVSVEPVEPRWRLLVLL